MNRRPLYELAEDGARLVDGIHYPSRHGDDHGCWAIFEPDDHTTWSLIHGSCCDPFTVDDEDFLAAVKMLGLELEPDEFDA